MDCGYLTKSLCSKGVCLNGRCSLSKGNLTEMICCSHDDCNRDLGDSNYARGDKKNYFDFKDCNVRRCVGGSFNSNGELTVSPTCERKEFCCINQNWENYCNWPGGEALWKRSACDGEFCEVSTWGAIYSYPLRQNHPNLVDVIPRFQFRQNWISLYKKLIIVMLNVENHFNLKNIFVRRSSSIFVEYLNEIETFLKGACQIWNKVSPNCHRPSDVSPFPFDQLQDFQNYHKFAEYNSQLDSIISGEYFDIPICSNTD